MSTSWWPSGKEITGLWGIIQFIPWGPWVAVQNVMASVEYCRVTFPCFFDNKAQPDTIQIILKVTSVWFWCRNYIVGALYHAPSTAMTAKHRQSWGRNMVACAYSGLWELTNQSRLGFHERYLKKTGNLKGWSDWRENICCSNGQYEKNNVFFDIEECKHCLVK